MWVNYGCRGDFFCGGRRVHCGAVGMYISTRTGQQRNCTCLLRTDANANRDFARPVPADVSAIRLHNNATYGNPRFM